MVRADSDCKMVTRGIEQAKERLREEVRGRMGMRTKQDETEGEAVETTRVVMTRG